MDSLYSSKMRPTSETSSLLKTQESSFYELSLQWSFSLPSGTIFTRTVIGIFFTLLCEMIAYDGIFGNLEEFVTKKDQLNLSSSTACIISITFQGE